MQPQGAKPDDQAEPEFDLTLDPSFVPLEGESLPRRESLQERAVQPSAREVTGSETVMGKVAEQVALRLQSVFETSEAIDFSAVQSWGLGPANEKWFLREDLLAQRPTKIEDAGHHLSARFQFLIVADDAPVGTCVFLVPGLKDHEVQFCEITANTEFAQELAEQANELCGQYGVDGTDVRLIEVPTRHVSAVWITTARAQVIVPICEPAGGWKALQAHQQYSPAEFLDALRQEKGGGGLTPGGGESWGGS